MGTNPSEIWQEYEKLMLKNAVEDKETAEVKKYKKDTDPRVGSDDETRTDLYNIKPEPAKGMEYTTNIVEIAHPNSVIIAPSYDPVNGLVENQNEQANIIRNRLMKTPLPSGTIRLQRLAAHKELTMELIRVAMDADNRDLQEIRQLADDCIAELQKEAGAWEDFLGWAQHKLKDVGGVGEGVVAGAGIGGTLGAIIGVWSGPGDVAFGTAGAVTGGIIGGLMAALGKTSPQIQNIQLNAQKAITQLQDLKSKIPEQTVFLEQIEQTLTALVGAANNYTHMIDGLELRHKDNTEVSNSEQMEARQLADDLKKQSEAALNMAKLFNAKAERGEFAGAEHSSMNPLYWFISDDVEDVKDALASLAVMIDRFTGTMETIGTKVQSAAETPAGKTPEAKPEEKKEEKPAVGNKDLEDARSKFQQMS